MPHIQQIKSKCFHNLFSAKAVLSVDQGQIQLISVLFLMTEEALKLVCLFRAPWEQ